MGIKNLNPFLKKKCDEKKIFKNKRISDFYGERIAIDGTNEIHILWARAYKEVVLMTDICVSEPDIKMTEEVFLKYCQKFIEVFLIHGITPILVFDGKHPKEKTETQAKRKQKKQDIKDKILEYRKKIENIDILSRTKLMNTELKALYCQIVSPSYTAVNTFRSILEKFGFPVLQAKGEAEELCVMLCLDGHAVAVMSTDTDVLTYNCPLLITGFEGYDSFATVSLAPILNELNIPYQTFVDLCIMSGCDYNTNIPNIASVKSYTLLLKYGSIDNLPKTYDIKCLNHEFCREQFKYKPSLEVSETNFTNLDINIETFNLANMYVKNTSLQEWYDKLTKMINSLPSRKPKLNIKRPSQENIPPMLCIKSSNSSSKIEQVPEHFTESEHVYDKVSLSILDQLIDNL